MSGEQIRPAFFAGEEQAKKSEGGGGPNIISAKREPISGAFK